MDSETLLISATALAGLLIAALSLLQGWQGWLALKHRELEEGRAHQREPAPDLPPAARIELADLKERIRRLEAIANGVDL